MSGPRPSAKCSAEGIGRDLLGLIDWVATHRLDVLTDSDWFRELIREEVEAVLRRPEERPGPWPV